MKLKDAFRYKSVLSGWIEKLLLIPEDAQYSTTELHMKNSVVSSEKNESIVVTYDAGLRECGINAAQAYDFARVLLQEYIGLSQAIDASMAMNAAGYKSTLDTARIMRTIASAFQKLSAAKAKEIRTTGTATYVSAAGTSDYSYPIITKKEPLLDPKQVAEAAKKLMIQADERSSEIDHILIETDVNYEPLFSVNDTFLTAARSAGIID